MMLVTQYPWWGPPEMKPPKVQKEQWEKALDYAYKRAEDEKEHDDDMICGWIEKEYEWLCDTAGLEAYTYE